MPFIDSDKVLFFFFKGMSERACGVYFYVSTLCEYFMKFLSNLLFFRARFNEIDLNNQFLINATCATGEHDQFLN